MSLAAFAQLKQGSAVWMSTGCGYPVPGEVVQVRPATGESPRRVVARSQLDAAVTLGFTEPRLLTPRRQEDMSLNDLTRLEELSEAAIIWSLKSRYDRGQIYTYIGGMLVSVNPNRETGLYADDVRAEYRHQPIGKLPAHIYAIGSAMLEGMIATGKDQVAILAGESGSGKTEAGRQLLRFLVSGSSERSSGLEARLTDAWRVLEAFGNARTGRHDNATRFAARTQIFFHQGQPSAIRLEGGLPEASRVVAQAVGERNFHAFYQVAAGLPAPLREKFGLAAPAKYFYLNQGRCVKLPGRDDAADFEPLDAALENLGFSTDQRHSVYRLLAAILHLGNVYFVLTQQGESVEIGNDGEVQWAAYLLQLDPAALKKALTTKTPQTTRGDASSSPLDIDRALDVRDAVAKSLYSALFAWLLKRINQKLHTIGVRRDSVCQVLDCFGFARQPVSSLEQLWVNLTNERLQSRFLSATFREEQAEYAAEELGWAEKLGSGLSNAGALELLCAKPGGLLQLLDEEAAFPKGSDESFLMKTHYNHVDSASYVKARAGGLDFGVRHYAGTVTYQVPGFLEKNRDVLRPAVLAVLRGTQSSTLRGMLDAVPPSKTTASAQFLDGLEGLLEGLDNSTPHFVRCVRANGDGSPAAVDLAALAEQTAALGLLETTRIRSRGFPHSASFRDFAGRYRCLLSKQQTEGRSVKEMSADILTVQGHRFADDYRLGKTKVFLRSSVRSALELRRSAVVAEAAVRLQDFGRAFAARRRFLSQRGAAIRLQAGLRGWRARREFRALKARLQSGAEKEARSSKRLALLQQLQERRRETQATEVLRERVVAGVEHIELPRDLQQMLSDVNNNNAEEGLSKARLAAANAATFAPPADLHDHPFGQFADKHFKGHVWGMRREPVRTPFLPKESDRDFEDSLKIFKLILRFMNEASLSTAQEGLLADYIIQQGLTRPQLRDEIFVQLANQTKGNGKALNAERGWWLMALAAAAFQPSSGLFKSLLHYVSTEAPQVHYRQLIAQTLLGAQASEGSLPCRRYPASRLEQAALRQKARLALETRAPDGSTVLSEVHSWITAAELAQKALASKGIRASRGWSVSLETAEVGLYLGGRDFALDLPAYLELPRDFPAQRPLFLIAPGRAALERVAQRARGRQSEPPAPPVSGARLAQQYNPRQREAWRDVPREPSPPPPPPPMEREVPMMQTRGPPPPTFPQSEMDESFYGTAQYPQSCISSHHEGEIRGNPGYAPSIASHVRRVPLPSRASEVDKFLDDLFDPILPDATLEDIYDCKSIAASIKGGGERAATAEEGRPQQMPQNGQGFPITQPMIMMVPMDPRMFASMQSSMNMTMMGADGTPSPMPMNMMPFQFPMNMAGGMPMPMMAMPNMMPETVVSGGSSEQRSSASLRSPNSVPSPPSLPPPEPFMAQQHSPEGQGRPMRGGGGFRDVGQEATRGFQMHETANGGYFVEPRGERRRSPTHFYREEPTGEMPHQRSPVNAPQQMPMGPMFLPPGYAASMPVLPTGGPPLPPPHAWEHQRRREDEAPPPVPRHQDGENRHPTPPRPPPHRPQITTEALEPGVKTLEREGRLGEWVTREELGRRPPPPTAAPIRIPKADTALAVDTESRPSRGPVLSYGNVPWELSIRKELFYPYEELSAAELELVFFQIVRDTHAANPFRIRSFERDHMLALLRSQGIGEANAGAAGPELRIRVVNAAREWALYFSRLFAVGEPGEASQLLGVSESGVRLLRRSFESPAEPLRVLEHLEFEDIDHVELRDAGAVVALLTVRGQALRVRSEKAAEIAQLIQEYFFGPNMGKNIVVATSDYLTKETGLLCFAKGDSIQLLRQDPSESGWLYGKLGGRIGHFPAAYTEPLPDPSLPTQPLQGLTLGDNILDDEEKMEERWENGGSAEEGKLTMMEFAMLYFRHAPGRPGDHKTSEKKSKKEAEWTWREMADQVKFSAAPLHHSLLRLQNPDFDKMALESFACIQRYMGDLALKKSQSLSDCVYELMLICHRFPAMRDEVYTQMAKQTTNNKSARPDSAIKGWRLFSVLTAYFDCSAVLRPYLLKYLADAAGDRRRAFHGTAQVCLLNLKKTFKFGGRKHLLAAKEIEAITHGKNLKRQLYHLPGGHKKVVNTTAVSVVEEMVAELCNELNVRSSQEQSEFCLAHIVESENVMKLLSHGDYVLDVTTELDSKGKDFFLLLKRTTWVHPLRRDNSLYIDVMFFQMVPDYLEGLLVRMGTRDALPAATMEAIARLGAYLYKSDVQWAGTPVSAGNVGQLVPRIVENLGSVGREDWAARVDAQLQLLPPALTPTEARAAFLAILESWPLFGSTFFFVLSVSDARVKGETLLALNKSGLHFLHILTHQVELSFGLHEILSTHKVTTAPPGGGEPMHFLDLKVLSGDVLTLQTEQGSEISRLLGQYIAVESNNRSYKATPIAARPTPFTAE